MKQSKAAGSNAASLMCRWTERRLAMDPDASDGLGGAFVRRHLNGCGRCASYRQRLAQLDTALRAGATRRVPSPDLRARVAGAYHQEVGSRPPDWLEARARLGWFGRSAWATGGLAVVTLVGSILWSRRDDFGDPPRTVRIEIPAGYSVAGRPSVTIKRASGVEEER